MAEKLPIITIVGRQNVGKSTLFNALIKGKKAIVDSFPGLTRDIISYKMNYKDYNFLLSDTPGLDISDSSELSTNILNVANEYLKKSSVIILLMESPDLKPFDVELANIIRKFSIPTIIAVNKIDDKSKMENLINFYELGFNEIIPISALNKVNLDLLQDNIILDIKKQTVSIDEPDLKVTIVGRPNSGKSTLLNSLIGFERAIVSNIPGTTRDSVNETFNFHKQNIEIIDTAGIRKKSKINENVEYYSFTRTVKAIEKSDVVIHLIDAEIGLSDTDKKIADEIKKENKPVLIAVNKWDLIEKDTNTFNEFKDKLIFKFYKADDFPIISISAIDKVRINKLIKICIDLKEKSQARIGTPALNTLLTNINRSGKIPQLGNKIKIYYGVQTDTTPPTFKLYVNNPELFRNEIIRFFEKAIQKEMDIKGVPILITIEGKKKHFKEKKRLPNQKRHMDKLKKNKNKK